MSDAVIGQIRQRLETALTPTVLEIIDEGDQHIGHAGEGQGHYRVRVVSPVFAGLPTLARHRLVYAAVDDLMGRGIHALAIEAGIRE